MKENIILIAIFILFFSGFGWAIYDRENNCELVTQEEKHIIIEKQIIRESTNNFGAFREEYKVLLENGKIEDLELDQYMSFKIGDSITITSTYEQRK
jgi:hypothetical protein